MELQPYIFFYGRCEEALEFYKKAIGGTYEAQPMPDDPGRVMHATFHGPGMTFMASDGRDVKAIDPEAGNITLSLSADSSTEGERVFKALSAGGKVTQAYGPAPWGDGTFGMCTDPFGNEWMITAP